FYCCGFGFFYICIFLSVAMGLAPLGWLDIDVDGDFGSENMLAEKPDPAGKGASSGKSVASPR
ncbi:hypothetical protein IPT14_07205, partial [Xanthomonas perforans]|nr:hypothetical protein [Xanthomonas perforans]